MSRALVRTHRIPLDAARRNETSMQRSVPRASVPTAAVQASFRTAWHGIRDAKDLHVAACAVAIRAADWYPHARTVHLITRNAKDFAPKRLATLDIRQQHPDAFLGGLWDGHRDGMAEAFRMLREDLPSGPTVAALLQKLTNDGQKRTAAAMQAAEVAGFVVL